MALCHGAAIAGMTAGTCCPSPQQHLSRSSAAAVSGQQAPKRATFFQARPGRGLQVCRNFGGFRRKNNPYCGCRASADGLSPSPSDTAWETAEANKQTVERLRNLIDQAIQREEYSEAARFRDELKALEASDDILRRRRELEKAIADERYADAAMLRDELAELEPKAPKTQIKCYSEAVTQGVRISVRSQYLESRSIPGEYFFAYKIRITNVSKVTVKLLTRHWEIKDASGRVEHVRGEGVVGQQPVIQPNESFEYTSACPLPTPTGTMEGEYMFVELSDRGVAIRSFDAKIGLFGLSVDGEKSVFPQ